jgi:hypothetical protein
MPPRFHETPLQVFPEAWFSPEHRQCHRRRATALTAASMTEACQRTGGSITRDSNPTEREVIVARPTPASRCSAIVASLRSRSPKRVIMME